ncbi:MAG: ABC transporter permease [Deltaproteobacteria bacterium]|nr:ABC transporter permease [Deltaproteobacteria bacterium]
MSLTDHLAISIDAILANPIRAFLTTLGVLIGVLAVVLLVGLGDAVRAYVLDSFANVGSNLLQIRAGRQETRGFSPPSMNVRNKLSMNDVDALEKRAMTVDGVSPLVFGTGELRAGDLLRDVMVIGVGARYAELRKLGMADGRFIEREDLDAHRRVVIVGQTIVRELFGSGTHPIGQTLHIAGSAFRIVGITEKKGKTFGFDMDDLAFVPATAAQDLFGNDSLSEILARAKDQYNVRPAVDEIGEVLKMRRGNTVDFSINSQDDMMGTVNDIMDTLTFALGAIASISLLVGGVGIMNIMLVSVKERTREIGVRRAVGAKKRDILLQFLVESVLVSLMGGVSGVGLGMLVVRVAHHIEPALPVELGLWNVLMALGFSALVGIVSGVVPAIRAAELDPVEALRYE